MFQWFSFLKILFAVLQVHAGPYIKSERFVEGQGWGGGLTCPGCSQGVWNSACWHISFTFLYLGRLLVCCVLAESSFFLRIFLPDARGRLARRHSRAGAISPSLAPTPSRPAGGGGGGRETRADAGPTCRRPAFIFHFSTFPSCKTVKRCRARVPSECLQIVKRAEFFSFDRSKGPVFPRPVCFSWPPPADE